MTAIYLLPYGSSKRVEELSYSIFLFKYPFALYV